MCPEEGILQTYLDGELDMDMSVRVAGHLAGCAACRERLRSLEELAVSTTNVFAPYRRETAAMGCPSRLPNMPHLPYLYQSLTKTRRFVNMFQRYKWFAGIAVSVLALAVFLSWAPGRGLAAQFLNIFRMERIQVVEITPEDMAQLAKLLDGIEGIDGPVGEVDIRNFGRVRVEHPPDAAWIVEADPTQVEELSGLKLNLPVTLAGRDRMEIIIEQPPTITFTPDVENLNSYLRTHSKVLLPPDLAGQTITFNIPPLLRAQYGQADQGFALYAARDLTIEVPQDFDLASLRQALLRLPFLPENFRRQLAAIEDWRHTLPIPEIQGMGATEISVNGNQGVYFVNEFDTNAVVLAWRQGDSWRAISGLPLEEALLAAAEVR
ncbi:MAG: zf-HC2 domain-containing protein [Dethiobacter sp.]|nr:zf-HC2 domain-containing protein [Dethiobacter sp.]MBS3900370.1 zf-HC2 domain-containing protein [Dethiobacter sp.]MBS3982796.1 zf-HC2 domain-containing protein [Dethiobacter sp.]MCL4464186.1 zf-HC2 domain-containing protein [Bacillota bacterium]